MFQFVLSLLAAVRVFFSTRRDTALEVLALRQQLAVLKRKRPRPPLNSLDRLVWTVSTGINDRSSTGFVVEKSPRSGGPRTQPRRPTGADFDDRGDRAADLSHPATSQNKQLSSCAFSLGMSHGGSCRVPDPAAHSWSPSRLSGSWPGRCIGHRSGQGS